MAGVGNRHLTVEVDFSTGISVHAIRDNFTAHPFLTQPANLFAFAVNNGALRDSSGDLDVVGANYAPTSELRLTARARSETLVFAVKLSCPGDEPAVTVELGVTNTGSVPVFLRLVMPIVKGLALPGALADHTIMIPQEIGSVVGVDGGPPIGMPLNLDVGLPTAMNSLEVACLYNTQGRGGVFFADVDGDPEGGVAPLQLTASAAEVAGFWIVLIAPGSTISVPRLAIGVHHGGDWHEAVDFYVSHHRPRWRFRDSPPWLRDQGAIYAYSGGGGILMAQPWIPKASLSDGAVWTTWQIDNGQWRDDSKPDRFTVQASTAGLAPAGAGIDAVARYGSQLDVFVVGHDGAIWTTWEHDDGPWRDGRLGRLPQRVTPPCLAPPGAPVVAALQNAQQLDVFVVGHDGAIWVTWELDDGPWRDGVAGRLPHRITPPGFARPGSNVVVASQNDEQLDVFFVGLDGAIWVTWCVDDGPWRDGNDGRMPARITPAGFAPPGAPLAVAKQSEEQLNVFVVRDDGAIWTTWQVNDGPWSDGEGGRMPARVSPVNFAPPGAHLAAAKQSDEQLDVFVVKDDGAIWVTWEAGDGPWTDGHDGRHPARVSTPSLAPPGAPLSAIAQNSSQVDVLVVGEGNAIWVTWAIDDGPWRDGNDGRLPMRVSGYNMAPAGSRLATARRGSGQLDAFAVGSGRIKSFRELPKLLEEARALGSDVVYLFDYWEGSDESRFPPYWNKGDYFIRADLGGEAALIDGIRSLHEKGGRIILYVEPFIIHRHSEIGRAKSAAWGGRWADGAEHLQYASDDSVTMVAPFNAWQDYIVSVCERLVCLCGADGIFLDSYGWQMNWPMTTAEEERFYPPGEHVRGVLRLTDRVRDAIRRHRPDAVVLGETAAGPVGRHLDAGLSAEFAWERTLASSRERILGSPIRYAAPEVAFFSNGRNLGELHQVYAAGHGLALSSFWPGSFMYQHRDHIKRLVEIRQDFKNALIHGKQEYQPETNLKSVSAYFYRGATDQIVTIVNASPNPVTIAIHLRQSESNSIWEDLLAPGITLAAAGTVVSGVTLEDRGLRLLRRLD